MNDPCLLCPEPADDPHHLTGRGHDGRYLDPQLVVPLCHSHHELAEDDLRAPGLVAPATASTTIESVAVRLQRSAIFLGRVIQCLAECLPGELGRFLAHFARSLQNWADDLDRSVQALDRYSPTWRAIPGI
jgi:hypothetical protein